MEKLKEKFYGIFDEKTVRQFESLEAAHKASPLFVVNSFAINGTKNSSGQNWAQHYAICDNQGNKSNFSKGGWRTGNWGSTMGFSPSRIYYDLIDPRGEVKQMHTAFTSIDIKNTVYEIIRKMEDVYLTDSWVSYDLQKENQKLKKEIEKLNEELSKLKATV